MKKIQSFLALTVLMGVSVQAMDIGAMRPSDKKYSAEVFYEAYKRDVEQVAAYSGMSFDTQQDEDRIIARLEFNPYRTWGLSLDVGATDSKESEGYVPMFGLGSHVVAYDANGFFGSVFAKATYVTEIKYKNDYVSTGQDYFLSWTEYISGERTETYWEYGIGAQFGKDWVTKSGSRITGYAGIFTSFINSEGEEKVWYHGTARGHFSGQLYEDSGYSDASGVDFEEDKPFTLFAGIEAALPNSEFGLRAEGRFVDQTSFSVGVFKNF